MPIIQNAQVLQEFIKVCVCVCVCLFVVNNRQARFMHQLVDPMTEVHLLFYQALQPMYTECFIA